MVPAWWLCSSMMLAMGLLPLSVRTVSSSWLPVHLLLCNYGQSAMGLALAACTKPMPRWLHMSFTQHGSVIWAVWLLSKPIEVSRQVCVELSWDLPTCVNERRAKLTAFLVVRILYDNPWPAISASVFSPFTRRSNPRLFGSDFWTVTAQFAQIARWFACAGNLRADFIGW